MADHAPACQLPAEWERQAGVMLTWPHPGTDWVEHLDQVEPVFARIGAAIAQHEKLLVVVQSGQHADHVQSLLQRAGAPAERLCLARAPANDTWARDHGPLSCRSKQGVVLHDFTFNGWGAKFDAALDNAINQRLHQAGCFGDAQLQRHSLVLEGGALETDGLGTLLATRHSILTDSRNPGYEQAAIEQVLRHALGLDRFLWLAHGALSGDDTDGHIDTLARFADADTILHVTAADGDPDQPGLQAMAGELAALRTRDGRPYRLIPLPPAGIHRDVLGRRLPATYANFLIINDAVLLPVYNVPQDAQATMILAEAFPGREIICIDCRAIIAQNGSLHCLTMQFPAPLTLQPCLSREST